MKSNSKRARPLSFTFLVLLVLGMPCISVRGQGTAFTYQGRLNDGAGPANGTYDLRFAIFDAITNGAAIAGPVTNAATGISNGLFTVTLDFGSGVFTGAARWLEIGVRTNAASSFVTLVPRQPLTPSPYAIYSEGAALAATASGVAPGSITGASIAPGSILASNIAGGQVVKSLNGLSDSVTLVPGPNMSISAVGNNLLLSAVGMWNLDGNSGTSPTNGNFLGTIDNQPLEIRANGTRALRFEPNTNGAPNVIGGAPVNFVDPGIVGATIGGGGTVSGNFFLGTGSNHVSAIFGTVGGGRMNSVGADHGTIAGGLDNTIQLYAYDGVIGGGFGNTLQTNAFRCAIGGGSGNSVGQNISFASIGGGTQNQIGSAYATIGGGGYNWIGTNSNSGTISGGYGHTIKDNSFDGSIGGGSYATIGMNSYYSTIAGGRYNSIGDNATAAVIAGGFQNMISSNAAYSDVSGGNQNFVQQGVQYSTISGGFQNALQTYAEYANIGGGTHNTNAGFASAISGGEQNFISYVADHSFIGAGESNSIAGSLSLPVLGTIGGGFLNAMKSDVIYSTIGGGYANTIYGRATAATIAGGSGNAIAANALSSTIGGGVGNTAFGYGTVVPGGVGNSAYGDNSFAAGTSAVANHPGAFVWSDPSGSNFSSTTSNQFAVRATGGVRFVTGGAGVIVDGELVPLPIVTTNDTNHLNIVNVLEGASVNFIAPGVYGATVSGGGAANYFGSANSNSITSDFGTIGGGAGNLVGGVFAAVGGGSQNVSSGSEATVAGGSFNNATNAGAAVLGGSQNLSGGAYSVIPGGLGNYALGNYSFAAGQQAQANHDGAFVWADPQNAAFASTATNQFLIRASGGVGINTANPAGAALNVAGTVKATTFQGDGSGLFNVGAGALGNYVFALTSGFQSVVTPNSFQDIVFAADTQLNGWVHAASTPQYTNSQTGLYLVQYNADASTITGTNAQLRVTLNGAEVSGSRVATTFSAANQILAMSKSLIAGANAGDVLTVQFTGSSTSVRLSGNTTLTITRIQ